MHFSSLKLTRLAVLALASGAISLPALATDSDPASQIGPAAEAYIASHPDKVGEAVATYLANHPEFLIAASETLHQRQQIAQQQAYTQLALQYQSGLLSSASPSVGPADAKSAVVMFFDYQCSWCSKMAPVVENLIKANPDTRFIFKEFPIFSSRWPVSGLAARVGEQVWLTDGGAKYLDWHNALYATGKVEGALAEQDVYGLAQHYLTKEKIAEVKQAQDSGAIHDALLTNQALAQHMNFSGTPAFVVMPQSKTAEANRVSVMPGSSSQDALQMAIQKAKG
ncbi:DsbA family protein [Klebsiella sp. RHBSTW-00484]|uniref:DsbA family protein n=1 Tax=unclassified Klebsiella TaxID=2608929 RepID=UPI0015E4F4AD|nr:MULTISPECIES: DsbA family protein [unclassified Klebsiella]MBA7843398.1 DsbA family protein [Klebsiella sp. RHBSTW-00465]QLO38766.1 DsbA family protein [Klebsiella sp. RHBSTW-00484]QLT78286.1 DsbA family protein [Klebsiella sp. RHBSTW-00464]